MMAFTNRIGNLLKNAMNSTPSIYQSIRCMSSSKLFVGGISYSTDDYSLKEAFNSYGEVVEARVIIDRESGRSKGFGFVTFTSTDDASAALSAMDGKELHGRVVHVNYAKEREGGFRSGGGSYGGGGGGYGGGYGGSGGYGGGYGGGYYNGGSGGYRSGGSSNYGAGDGNFSVAGGGGSGDSYLSGSAGGGNYASNDSGVPGFSGGHTYGSNNSGGAYDDKDDDLLDEMKDDFEPDDSDHANKRS